MRDECIGFAVRLRRVLGERQLTQSELGRRMAATAHLRGLREIAPVPRQTISEWGRGRRLPDADYALILCYTLEVTPASLALEGLLTPERIEAVKASARSRADRAGRAGGPARMAAPEPDLESVHLTSVLHATRVITRHDVDELWGVTLDLLEMRRTRSALVVLPVLSSHLVGLRDMMRLATGDRVRRELGMQIGETACGSAQLWHTQLDLGRAMSGYRFALSLADDMDEDSLRAMAFTGMALLYADQLHQGEGLPGGRGEELMAQAERAAAGCEPSHQVWMHAARSWQRAGRKDEAGAGHDLEAAHRALARLGAPPRGFLGPIDGTYVTVCEAKCSTLLGDPRAAVELYGRAAAGSGPMTRLFYDVERARAAIAAGQVDLAVGLLFEAVEEGERAGSTMITRRVQSIAATRLARHRDQADVRALEERLTSVA